jgi:hypothetical protein
MMNTVRESSNAYELRGLSELIREVEGSTELHVGPVIVVPFALWPFRGVHPRPVSISRICSDISAKYGRLFPSRILKFPIDDWVVHVRDTIGGATLVGNGVQAEVLLFLNNNSEIGEEALEPHITSGLLLAAIKSLAEGRAQVIREEGGKYRVNEQFKGKGGRIVLPRPVVVDVGGKAQLNALSGELVDSAIVRIAKGTRVINEKELESRVKDDVAGHFALDHAEFKQRLSHLASRNFVEIRESGEVLYLP